MYTWEVSQWVLDMNGKSNVNLVELSVVTRVMSAFCKGVRSVVGRPCYTDAHDGWLDYIKEELAPWPIDDDRVRLLLFPGGRIYQPFVECCGFLSLHHSGGKHLGEWSPHAQHPEHTGHMPISWSPHASCRLQRWSWVVARWIWVKNPYIKICMLRSRPESSCTNVKHRRSDGCAMVHWFTTARLEWSSGAISHIREKWGSNIT